MKYPSLALFIVLFSSCKRSEVNFVKPVELSSSPEAPVSANKKGHASKDGLEDALRDISKIAARFKEMSAEDLINSIAESKPGRYGGYEYYYFSQLNHHIVQELRKRGEKARPALRKYQNSKLSVYEAVNGPGDTVGSLCQALERELNNAE